MKKKNKIIISTIVSVIILVLVIVSFLFIKNKDIKKQKDVVNQYFSYINDKKYEEMYNMISKDSMNNITKDDFVTRNKNIYDGIDASNIKIEIIDTSKENNINKITYSEKMYTSAGEVYFTNQLYLNREGRDYKIEWNSKLIFPELEDDYKVRISTIKATRGSILDRNGEKLAYDGKISQVGIVPGKLEDDKEQNIAKISELLGISTEKIGELLSESYVKDDTFVPLKKMPKDSDLKDKLLQIPGIMITSIDGRVYRLGEEAAHLIGYIQDISAEELDKNEGKGYTSKSIIGKSGIELAYEDTLRGIDGAEIYIQDESGNKIKEVIRQEKQDGKDVKLTIDYNLQKEFYEQMKNDKGFFVVMDPQTGELLSLVSTPSYNSNDFILGMATDKWNSLNNDKNMPLYNRFKQAYAPGSTFKPITASIGLTENIIDLSTEYSYSGTSWQKDKSWGDYYITTLTAYNENKNVENALIRSDNIYFSQLALNIGKNKMTEYLDKIGFNEQLDIKLGLKSSQYLNEKSEFNDIKLANTGYGQGDVLINPVHMASIYTAFVNNGNMLKPYIEYQNEKSTVFKEKVFSEEAVVNVKNALRKVIDSPNGTAHDAKIDGLDMIGKTGTAELKKSKEDKESGTLGWFNCITLNRNDGNLLIVGMVENTQNNSSGGSHYVISKIKKVIK